MSKQKGKIPPEQLLAAGLVTAAAIGMQLYREARRSPEERAKDAAKRAKQRNAKRRADQARSRYHRLMKEAETLDRHRWREFNSDPDAIARLDAESRIPIRANPANGSVTRASSGSLWGVVYTYIVSSDGDEFKLIHRIDGDCITVELTASVGNYRSGASRSRGCLVIGTRGEAPDRVFHRMAEMFAAVQAQGHWKGIDLCLLKEDHQKIETRHYADFARARGWPEERGAEAIAVSREHSVNG